MTSSYARQALVLLLVSCLPWLSSCSSEGPVDPGPASPGGTLTTVQGLVRDAETGSPIEGVNVSASASGVVVTTASDGSGTFAATLPLSSGSSVVVTFTKDGYITSRRTTSTGAVNAALTAIKIVTGTITEIDGTPLPGVTVSSISVAATTTDASGHFSVATGFGVTFFKDGFLTRSVTRPPVGSNDVGVVRLQRWIFVDEGKSIPGSLTSNDLEYYVDDFSSETCNPCQLIQIVKRTDTPHDITATLEWTGPVPIQIWFGTKKGTVAAGGSSATISFSSGTVTSAVYVYVGLQAVAEGRPAPLQAAVPFQLTVR